MSNCGLAAAVVAIAIGLMTGVFGAGGGILIVL